MLILYRTGGMQELVLMVQGYSSKIIEEEEIEFDDNFIDSCIEGEEKWYPI